MAYWLISTWNDPYECILCDGDINKGDQAFDFGNPCCEMGNLSICRKCMVEANDDRLKFEERLNEH
jgi:hypothetical protein